MAEPTKVLDPVNKRSEFFDQVETNATALGLSQIAALAHEAKRWNLRCLLHLGHNITDLSNEIQRHYIAELRKRIRDLSGETKLFPIRADLAQKLEKFLPDDLWPELKPLLYFCT